MSGIGGYNFTEWHQNARLRGPRLGESIIILPAIELVDQYMKRMGERIFIKVLRTRMVSRRRLYECLDLVDDASLGIRRCDRVFSQIRRMLQTWRASVPAIRNEATARWIRDAMEKWQDTDSKLTQFCAWLRRTRITLSNMIRGRDHPGREDCIIPNHPGWYSLTSSQRRHWILTGSWERAMLLRANWDTNRRQR